MPERTLARLATLATRGATVIFEDGLPDDVPGLGQLEKRRAVWRKALPKLPAPAGDSALQTMAWGKGQVLVGELLPALKSAGIVAEPLAAEAGVRLIRRRIADGRYYFVANQSTNVMDGWYRLAHPAASVAILDPMTSVTGEALIRPAENGACAVRLMLPPGHSIILRTRDVASGEGPAFAWPRCGREAVDFEGPWQVTFVQGGPVMPTNWTTKTLVSWTKCGDPAAEAFAGTALYRTTFAAGPIELNKPRLLDLGEVKHVAHARLNGRDLGVAFMHPYVLAIPPDLLRTGGNVLEIEVTNLAANRIRDLDRRKVAWRVFHDANVVNIQYKPFDASNWPVFESGLLGPVSIRTRVGD